MLEDIFYFQNEYEKNPDNKSIENRIRKLGIMKASVDEDKREKMEFKFNIEIPETKIHNQKNSYQCNIYAFLRVINSILQKSPSLDVKELDLSPTYISFFDKLEKVNMLYNDLISHKKLCLELINDKVNQYIGIYGTFHFCRELVNKYGLVPVDSMREANNTYNEFLVVELLKDKVKVDSLELIKISNKKQRQEKKKDLMKEIYEFLAKVMGAPPKEFKFMNETLTPLEFRNKYLKTDLNEYVTVTSFDKQNYIDSNSFIPNIYLNDNEKIIHISSLEMEKLIISQLRDGVGVCFTSEESSLLDYDYNILDDTLYNYHDLLNIKNTTKNKKILLDLVNYDHAMCITGALLENDEIKQFKVDNSFGKHGKFNGQLIMTPSFLKNCVITTIIDKKYLK